jgi:GAF domain-containing protein
MEKSNMGKIEATILHTLGTAPGERMKAGDLDFYSLLRRQADEGRLFFNQRRAIIFDTEAMGLLRQQLVETLGQELAMGILLRFGYAQGYKDAETLNASFEWESDADWLVAGPTLHMLEGIALVEPQKIEFDRETGDFYMQGIWRNSYEAEEHLKCYGPAEQPICWTLIGYASGYTSRVFGRELLALETACMGKGDEHCRWEIRPVTDWGAEVEPYLKALQQVNLSPQIQRTQQQGHLDAFMADVGQALTQSSTLREMLQACTEAITAHLEAAFARIWTFNSIENMLELQASAGIYTHINGGHARVPVGKFKIGLIAQEREPHLTNDVLNDPRVGDKEWAKSEGLVAFVGYPLIVEDRLVGVMAMFARKPLPDSIIQAMAAVSRMVALSIDHKQVAEITAKQAIELATAAEVSSAASTILETDKLLWEVANLTKERFKLYHAHIYLLSETGDRLNLVAGAGEVGQKMVDEGWSIPLHAEQSIVAQAARTGQGVIVNDVRQHPDYLPNSLLPDTHSEMAVPMTIGEAVLGVLDIQSDEVNHFTEADIFTKTILASQVASAVQNARLFESVIEAQQEMAVVNEVLQEVSRQLDLEPLLETVYNQIKHIVSVDIFIVGLFEPSVQQITYPLIYNNNVRYEKAPGPVLPGSRIEQVLNTGEPILINRTPQELEEVQLVSENILGDTSRPSTSLLYIPLHLGRQTIGVISVQSYRFDAYDNRDLVLLNNIAGQVSVAVENIRLYKQAQARAQREHMLREITTRVRNSVDVDTIMRTAAQELGRALGRPAFIYLDDNPQETQPSTVEKEA